MSEEHVKLIPAEAGYYFIGTKKKQTRSMFFCLSLYNTEANTVILIDFGLPNPMSQRTMSTGTVTFPSADSDIVRDQLCQLSVHKSMGPDVIHQVLWQDSSWTLSKGPGSLGKCSLAGSWPAYIPVYKKDMRGNQRPVCLTSVPGKTMEKIILGSTERHSKNNTVISQPTWLQKGEVWLNNSISLCHLLC